MVRSYGIAQAGLLEHVADPPSGGAAGLALPAIGTISSLTTIGSEQIYGNADYCQGACKVGDNLWALVWTELSGNWIYQPVTFSADVPTFGTQQELTEGDGNNLNRSNLHNLSSTLMVICGMADGVSDTDVIGFPMNASTLALAGGTKTQLGGMPQAAGGGMCIRKIDADHVLYGIGNSTSVSLTVIKITATLAVGAVQNSATTHQSNECMTMIQSIDAATQFVIVDMGNNEYLRVRHVTVSTGGKTVTYNTDEELLGDVWGRFGAYTTAWSTQFNDQQMIALTGDWYICCMLGMVWAMKVTSSGVQDVIGPVQLGHGGVDGTNIGVHYTCGLAYVGGADTNQFIAFWQDWSHEIYASPIHLNITDGAIAAGKGEQIYGTGVGPVAVLAPAPSSTKFTLVFGASAAVFGDAKYMTVDVAEG
jgi:hypothetical protein